MKLEYFSKEEFDNYDNMDTEFLLWLDDVRDMYGKAIRINSSYRDPNHNETVGGVKASAHTEIPCKAVDIHIDGSQDRFVLIGIAISMGCPRIGVGETFVHLDFSKDKPQNVMWDYY